MANLTMLSEHSWCTLLELANLGGCMHRTLGINVIAQLALYVVIIFELSHKLNMHFFQE